MEAKIEAALYAAGRPLSAEELAKVAGITSKRKAISATRSIAARVNPMLKAIRIVELEGRKFVMELRPEYNPVAKKVALRSLIPQSVLKTLSYLVYSQPITSHELAMKRGSQVYGHLRMLEEIGFVQSEQAGKTRRYRSTPLFSHHYGLSEDAEEMRRQLAKYMSKDMAKANYKEPSQQEVKTEGSGP